MLNASQTAIDEKYDVGCKIHWLELADLTPWDKALVNLAVAMIRKPERKRLGDISELWENFRQKFYCILSPQVKRGEGKDKKYLKN